MNLSFDFFLRNGVENMLMHYIPEVKGIEEVGQMGETEAKLEFKTDATTATTESSSGSSGSSGSESVSTSLR